MREIAGEVFLVPVCGKLAELQQIFVLNPVGSHIWNELDGHRDLQTLSEDVVENFEVSLEQAGIDVADYLSALEEAGLVVEEEPSSR